MTSKQTKIAENQTIALQENLGWHVVAVFSQPGSGHGTGVAIQYNGHYFIATAKHVIQGGKEFSILSRTEKPLVYVGRKQELDSALFYLRKSVPRNTLKTLQVKKMHHDSDADLALLELEPSSIQALSPVSFKIISKLNSVTPPIGTRVFLIGFADEASQFARSRRTGVVAKILNFYSDSPTIVADRDDLSNFSSRYQFLMDYPYVPNDAALPHGLSGCGIWQIFEQDKNSLWSVGEPELVGIQTHWYPDKDLLKAVRIERLMRLIGKAVGKVPGTG